VGSARERDNETPKQRKGGPQAFRLGNFGKMGIRIRQRKDKPGEWWVFVNHEGKRFSQRGPRKSDALQIAAEFHKTLMLYKAQHKVKFALKAER